MDGLYNHATNKSPIDNKKSLKRRFKSGKVSHEMVGIGKVLFRNASYRCYGGYRRKVELGSVRHVRTAASEKVNLRKIFDEQKYYNDFNKGSRKGRMIPRMWESSPKRGLFLNEKLVSPQGLIEFSNESLSKAKKLVDDMLLNADNEQGKLSYVRKLDQLSDLLCRVIDLAEFIRVVHLDSAWVEAAQLTHEMMFEYMNQLNTNVELYSKLKEVLEDSTIRLKLTDEEVEVAEYLKHDFERSGIHMDPQTRENFVAITQRISLLGSQFNEHIHSLENYWCEIPAADAESISPPLLKEIRSYQSSAPRSRNGGKSIKVPLAGHMPYSLLVSCPNSNVRKTIWIALHNSTKKQIEILDAILKYRALLANMLGYKSYAHYQLEFKMAKTPENVITFLENLQKHLLSSNNGVFPELKRLCEESNVSSVEDMTEEELFDYVKPWDRDYLLAKQHAYASENREDTYQNINEYLSVGTIMAGLNKLCEKLYNISFIPVPTGTGETWNSEEVRKIEVFDNSTNEVLGYLYLDFWSPKVLPSHFTIVCLRDLNLDIGSETRNEMRRTVQLDETETRQLPIVCLICNFSKASDGVPNSFNESPTLLSLEQVDTIFHEMGHAIHSMIGCTKLQNLSGTRCLTDFVELPSVLMEFFSKDPRVLCNIAAHYITGEPLPLELLKQYQSKGLILNECETFMQSKMALLDQVLHGEQVIAKGIDNLNSTEVYHKLESDLKVFADKWSTWHAKFPHLFSYGAVYYSYLLDRAIAKKIWNELFEGDPWNSEAGAKYKNSTLKWGGTRDPWHCLADALNIEQLKKGNSKAMEIIAQQI